MDSHKLGELGIGMEIGSAGDENGKGQTERKRDNLGKLRGIILDTLCY